jgi:diguanylate cyclase (GGDEF)-like protein
MTLPAEPCVADRLDRALSVLIADAAIAAQLASDVLALPEADADAGQRAIAHGVLALCALREGEVADGVRHIDAAQVLLGAGAADVRAAQLLEHVRAQWHRREGRLAEAETLLRALHARAEQRPAGDAYLTAAALGIVLSMRGDDDGALETFYGALVLARRSGADTLLVNALNNLGSYHSDLHNFEDARPMLEECLQGALRLGSRRQIIYAAGTLTQCLGLKGRPAEALAVARAHLIGNIRADDLPALQRDEEIAQALLDNGLVDEAEAALGEELHDDTMSNEQATARVCLHARILLQRGRAGEALRLCLDRQAVLQQEGGTSTGAIDRVDLLRVTAQAAAAVADHALAYTQLDHAWAIYERLLGRAAKARRLGLEIVHRLGEAERERDTARRVAAGLESLNASLRAQVAENERLQQQLRLQVLEDPLTGLHNRRYLQETGAALLALARRRGDPLAAGIVDLDHFKRVNDRHGHDAGDRVLQGFARLARGALRASDLVCRSGGEEFVLLLPGADAAQARARLERMLGEFRSVVFEGAGAHFACTFSAGIALPLADESLEHLLRRADVALYAAKAAGRARVVIASEKSIET